LVHLAISAVVWGLSGFWARQTTARKAYSEVWEIIVPHFSKQLYLDMHSNIP
jgi:hypothetical protein